jgi:hypothetical protein
MEMCDEQGGINFQLIHCLEEADRLCKEIVLNAWELEGIEEYYHKMERRLDACPIALSCAFATVCVTLNCITNLPAQVYQLAHDLRGLIVGDGNNLYNRLRQSAYRADISIPGTLYGDLPQVPKALLELAELKDTNAQLTKEVIYYKRKVHTMKQSQRPERIIHVAGNYIAEMTINNDIHDNHGCNIYALPDAPKPEAKAPSSTSAEALLGIPAEGKYTDVRKYIEERCRFDEEFKRFCAQNTRVALCQRLSSEFGWTVDHYALGRNINRKRKRNT